MRLRCEMAVARISESRCDARGRWYRYGVKGLVLTSLVLLLSVGCSTVERAEECRAVRDTLNPSLAAMEAALVAKTPGWASIAAKSAALIGQLRALRLRDRTLAQSVSDIATNLEAVQKEARRAAEARASRANGDDSARQQLSRILAKHGGFMRETSKYCYTP
jgi:hypothetical protein